MPGDTENVMGHVSSIVHDFCQLINPKNVLGANSSTPAPITPSTHMTSRIQLSPPSNTPSKLRRYLHYAEEHLGVRNATTYEDSLDREGYGPDILSLVEDKALIECGLTPGDAICLKRGANEWWNGPDAKRQKQDTPQGQSGSTPNMEPEYSIRFEKRLADGGCVSFFSSGLMSGRHPKKFSWWYYNQITRDVEPVPVGKVPVLDPQYYDDSFGGGVEEEDSDENAGAGDSGDIAK